MPRAQQNKLYRTFVRGLITEAGFLTYPEDASYDELNTVLFRKGNRARRLGQSYGANTFVPELEKEIVTDACNEFVWKAVNNEPDTNFLVTQTGNIISFFDLADSDIAAAKKSYSLNLTDHLAPSFNSTASRQELSYFSSGKGLLFIVNKTCEPLVLEYNPDTDTFSVTEIKILIRDFDGLDDGLKNDEEPPVLTAQHHYNLQNQGWVLGSRSSSTFSPVTLNGYLYEPEIFYYNRFNYSPGVAYQASTASSPIFTFFNELGRYPGNNKQWWVARAEADDPDSNIEAGDFLPKVLNKLFSGNNRAPRGHYILDAFKKDRTLVSGISGLGIEEIDERPNATAFFSGRAWYGQGSTVYYSQILDATNASKAGLCYQEADPTAEDISELISTDGGVVPIPEIDRIVRLVPMANGVIVFALNGVWFISGGDAAFSATNISVSKISPIGTNSPLSIIETDGQIYWWSEIGINALSQESGQFGPIPGKFGNSNISEQTLQSFWDDIPNMAKAKVKACYDTRNNVINWLYQTEENSDTVGPYEYNASLQFDLTLQSFYPWKFGSIDNGPKITGLFLDTGFAQTLSDVQVTNNSVVVTDSAVPVTVGEFQTEIEPSNIYYTVSVPDQGFVLSQANDQNYSDWKEFDGTGVGYESFIETGFEIHNDAMRDKQITYLFAHFAKTETEEGLNPSSCYMTTKWDWSNRAASNKWSNTVQVYRPRIRPNPTTQELVNGFDVVTSKNKVRGNGKAIQFRFGTNEIGKTFDLLGWSVAYVGNTVP